MKENIKRIKEDFSAFSQRIKAYQGSVGNIDYQQKDSCEAAYEGLYKLMQRIKKELKSGVLNNQESRICYEIKDDNYLNGLLELRKVGTHIQSDTAKKSGCFQIYLPSGQPIEISCEVSAGALFSDNTFTLPELSFGIDKFNHLKLLNTAKDRIEKKLGRLVTN